ncbi:hypothetical protein HELRODRAFT_176649 [Helobdella robusta]|uniref:Uncharacterized protein n=1 Tax=Helobdella robusta TaxID=6412 RepID=T1FAR4_HELRO|nr:hypothetical protein HELRODRAFT_176649 [Helobdella robusta]ESN99879.1 hypothetical protein HELRODRAFT_176649 [Helobdella robusta]
MVMKEYEGVMKIANSPVEEKGPNNQTVSEMNTESVEVPLRTEPMQVDIPRHDTGPTQNAINDMMKMMTEQMAAMKGMMTNMMKDMGTMKTRICKIEEGDIRMVQKEGGDRALRPTPRAMGPKNKVDKRKKDEEDVDDLVVQEGHKKRITGSERGETSTQLTSSMFTQEEFNKQIEKDFDRHIDIMERYTSSLYDADGRGAGVELTQMERAYAESRSPIHYH